MLPICVSQHLPAELYWNVRKYLATPTAIIIKKHIIDTTPLPWHLLSVSSEDEYSSNEDY